MSKASEAKKGRRKKRQATRDERWVPDSTLDELEATDAVNVAAELEVFDARITERGWTFDDELSDDDFAVWFYTPSGAAVGNEGLERVTSICLLAAENAEVVHLVLVGTAEEHLLDPEEFFERIESIEAYRVGNPVPVFE
jgi:hypothetical protein